MYCHESVIGFMNSARIINLFAFREVFDLNDIDAKTYYSASSVGMQ